MSVFGEAALSAFLELLSAKLLDSVLNFVADYGQIHQQLKLWQSILPEIKAVLNHAEEKQIKDEDEGVKNWLGDLQDLAYDVDDILDDFAYQELRLKLQKTQAQASTKGFLQSKAEIQGTGLGNQYFQDLVSRSFFQRSSKDKSLFVMHDLMNDLAQLVAGEICCRLVGEKQQKFSHRSRHSAYVSDDWFHSVKKFEAFYQMTSLRTFLPLLKGSFFAWV
ncbi:hypothetical protein PVK06_018283 [Gossypium arboreum]|uniref:Disease resistance RPP13-like protein 1 n=1 Tax=Gossypium arboreum TaxID=29729 RepID=A0ABR0Q526_GOSAR|nr:hypothetical protein PVK06_018283 [Gossypium arboreum]